MRWGITVTLAATAAFATAQPVSAQIDTLNTRIPPLSEARFPILTAPITVGSISPLLGSTQRSCLYEVAQDSDKACFELVFVEREWKEDDGVPYVDRQTLYFCTTAHGDLEPHERGGYKVWMRRMGRLLRSVASDEQEEELTTAFRKTTPLRIGDYYSADMPTIRGYILDPQIPFKVEPIGGLEACPQKPDVR